MRAGRPPRAPADLLRLVARVARPAAVRPRRRARLRRRPARVRARHPPLPPARLRAARRRGPGALRRPVGGDAGRLGRRHHAAGGTSHHAGLARHGGARPLRPRVRAGGRGARGARARVRGRGPLPATAAGRARGAPGGGARPALAAGPPRPAGGDRAAERKRRRADRGRHADVRVRRALHGPGAPAARGRRGAGRRRARGAQAPGGRRPGWRGSPSSGSGSHTAALAVNWWYCGRMPGSPSTAPSRTATRSNPSGARL